MAALSAAAAPAQTLELLGPSGAVAPEGFPIALRAAGTDGTSLPLSEPRLETTGAEVRPGLPQPPLATYLVVPHGGAREVRIRAFHRGQSVEARYSIGPPASMVQLELNPPAPVKQLDAEATLSVRLLRPDGAPDVDSAPPVIRSNVGTIADLSRVGPGEFRARYVLPSTRHPEVAVIVALSAWPHPQSVHGAFGAARVPMASAIDLPGKTEPNADFQIIIAGKRWGPVKAGPDGRFKLPVVVPPGYGTGIGTATDRVGNRRTRPMSLMVPETDQLSCVLNPSKLRADGVSVARVLCATSDPFGKAAAATKVEMSAKKGVLGPPRLLENGVVERIYTAPRTLAAEPDLLTATWRQGKRVSREELRIELTQGPAEKADVRVAEPLVHHGGRLPFQVNVKDALDRPRPGAKVEARASAAGAFDPLEERPGRPGELVGAWHPTEAGAESSAELTVRAFGPMGTDPARIVTWAEGGALFAAVTDLADLPVPGQALFLDDREIATGPDGTVRIGPLADGRVAIRHELWPGLSSTVYVRDGGKLVYPAGAATGRGSDEERVVLGPPIPVNVRIEVAGKSVTYWVETPKGVVIPSRPVRVALSSGTYGPPVEREGRSTITVSVDRASTVSVADKATGVTALAEVRP
ncbi:MAG: hypothetical protein HYZ28_18505 [Myxococcales bacterium]|nr:hypothetical protein [Myxococcales bacterium]